MKEAIVHPDLHVEIIDSPIPKPDAEQVLIKVIVSGSNPKDWKLPQWTNTAQNSGDDIAGVVASVGSDVTSFKVGDRVAAFHTIRANHGSFAEYALAAAHTTFHLPSQTSFEEGATIPLAAMTAAIGLFVELGLPEPWTTSRDQDSSNKKDDAGAPRAGPLVIYGGASAVGAFAIQLAKYANIGPLIVVAGKGIPFVETFLNPSAGDVVVDYRKGDDQVVSAIVQAVKQTGKPLQRALDAVSEKGSYDNIIKAMQQSFGAATDANVSTKHLGNIATVLPLRDGASSFPSSIKQSTVMVSHAHETRQDFASAWFHLFSRGLAKGWLKAHPTELVPGGLAGIQTALANLKQGKASAVKYVFRIADTEGLSSGASS